MASLTEAELNALAEAYAPVLFFHPLDEFTLQDPTTTFEDPVRGKIYERRRNDQGNEITPILVEDSLNLTTMLRLSKPDITDANDVFFEHVLSGDYKRGAGYTTDPNNSKRQLSRAPIHYNVFETGVGGTWVINYWFYYAWNAPQTFGFGVGRGQYSVVEIDPYGEHEGDWESMSVLVCSTATPSTTTDASEPIAVTYQQHGFSQITDCTIGECIFFQNSNHPVGFVSVNSHATYPVSSRNHVYAVIGINLLYFVPGFAFLADQTVWRNEETGVYKMWYPNATNIWKHANPWDVTLETSRRQDFWQAYGGRWGETRVTDVQPPKTPPICMNTAQSQFVDCPKIPLITSILDLLGSGVAEALGCAISALAELLQRSDGPLGPGRKDFFGTWLPPEAAMLWTIQPRQTTTKHNFCEWLGDPVTADGENSYNQGFTAFSLSIVVGTTSFVSNIGRFIVELFSGG